MITFKIRSSKPAGFRSVHLPAFKTMLSFILSLCLLLSGCGVREKEEDSFRIVTSFYPMYIMALNLTQGVPGEQVENMAGQQAGCLHDYQLQSKDMQNLQKADLFVINGAGMESFLEDVKQQLPSLPILVTSQGIPLLEEEDHSHEEESEHGEEQGSHEGHEHGEVNPHVWVSISDAILQVENFSEGLTEADPIHGEQYRKNAEIYIEKLETLREEMHQALDGLEDKRIITFHEAFPYFAQEFGLEIVKVINREPESQPSAKELAETIREIRETGVKAVFAEPQYPESAANIVAEESGAGMYFLDPCTTGEESPDAYLNAMRKNMEVLKTALAG